MTGIYWLASYPKSGSTWLRVFLQNLLDDGDAPADINRLSVDCIASSRAWLDDVLGFGTDELTSDEAERLRRDVYDWSLQGGRALHKIHDAYTTTAEGEPLVGRAATRGALYTIRNPLDVAVSAAKHWNCPIDRAIDRMSDTGMVLARSNDSPNTQVPQRLLTWSAHVRSWVDAPGLDCCVLRYEDMQRDPVAAFTRAAEFLDLPSDAARVEKAVRFSDLEELADQEAKNGFRERPAGAERFFRRERYRDWRGRLSGEQVGRVVADHGEVMRRFGYLDERGEPLGVASPRP